MTEESVKREMEVIRSKANDDPESARGTLNVLLQDYVRWTLTPEATKEKIRKVGKLVQKALKIKFKYYC